MNLEISDWVDKELKDLYGAPLFKKYFRNIEMIQDEDTVYFLNKSEGIGITMPKTLRIDTIQLYAEGKDGSSMFKADLPHNLNFSFNRTKVRQTLGVPQRSGGGQTILYIGYTANWDKYFFDRYTLHLQYANDNNSIQLLTIASLKLEEYFNSTLQ
jgi:hypothetical protein